MIAGLDTPVDRDTGRRLIEEELSKQEYSASDLTPLERIGQWLNDLLGSIINGALAANSPWLIILVVVAVAALIALIVWRVRRAGLKRTRIPTPQMPAFIVTDDPVRWRTLAGEAAAHGDLRGAVTNQARAIFAVLAEAGYVPADSALTAHEIGELATTNLPTESARLRLVSRTFEDLTFGRVPDPGPEIYREFLAIDEHLSHLPRRSRAAETRRDEVSA